MPSILPSRRSRVAESDDDEDAPAREQTPSSSARNDSKRLRRNDAPADVSQTSPPGPAHTPSPSSDNLQLRQRRSDAATDGSRVNGRSGAEARKEHQPGAIVRVKLRNFVTYSAVEFFPGPNLNMVIGPNGSGKSSLVCAICLGLGWGSQHLGRARDVSEFVKTGCREASIEIELQRNNRLRNNPVITRIIKKGDSKSYYTLDGSATSGKNVQTLARSMNIQIDNLCQFLPQDKVVEFAAMTPIELLQSTQRAAAGPEMLEQHESLKKLRAHHKELLNNSKGDREVLRNLESRQEMQRDDVQRLRQRDQTKKKIEWMERCRPIPKYAAAKDKVKAAKERKVGLAIELKKLKADLAPVLRLVNGRQSYEVEVRKALQHGREVADKADRTAENAMKKVLDVEQKLTEADGLIEAEKRSVKAKKEDQKRIRGVAVRIKKQMEEEPGPFDAAAANDKMAEINSRRRQLTNDVEELNGQIKDSKTRGQTAVADQSSLKGRLADLDTQAGQQEHKLQQTSSDSHRAWTWIQAHQDEFEHKVYGPPMIECSLSDSRYADAVESLFQVNDFRAFTAQSTADFYKLQRALTKEMKLQDVSFRVCSNSSMAQYRSPLSPDQLGRCGMDGWAIDFLKGPEVVLAMLCGEKGLHATAISLDDISQEQFSVLEDSDLRSWVVNGTSFHTIRRREYGAAGNSTRTRTIREARIWTDRPVDPAAKEKMQAQIQEFDLDISAIRDELKRMVESKREMAAEHQGLGEELETVKADKDEKQRAMTIYKSLPTKLAQEEEKLAAIDQHMEGVRGRVSEILQGRDKGLLEKVHATLKYTSSVTEYGKIHNALLELEMQHLEAKSDFETLRTRNEHINTMLTAKQDEEKAAGEESMREAVKAKELVIHVKNVAAEARDLAQAGDSVLEDYLAEFGRKSSEELEAEIESERARLDLTHEGNGNIIQEFEDRQRRIDKLERGLEKFHQQKERFVGAIEELRTDWEPKLDALVAKISDAFSDSFARIGCAGQVTIFKASGSEDNDSNATATQRQALTTAPTRPAAATAAAVHEAQTTNGLDFAHWALHILVKFRSEEPLSLLDSHRQSGGERAVSTIFYLMALQSLSQAPFRVVDEINQGMDPRNERMVHGRMVDVACGSLDEGDESEDGVGERRSGGQYFLITPKLLSGLKYRRGMRVLNIVSGAVIPSPPTASSTTPIAGGDSGGATTNTAHVVDFGTWVRRAREIGLAATKRKALKTHARARAAADGIGV